MAPPKRVSVAAVRKLGGRRIEGSFWHQGAVARPLLSFASPARGDGRYHRAGGPGAWYASSKERAAWAEFFRHHVSAELSPLEVKRKVGRVEVEGLNVLDLTDPDVQAELDLADDDLLGDDISLCQAIADAARAAGLAGILAPSAAMSGEATLVVFGPGMRRVHEVNSRVQRPPKTLRRVLERIRVPGPTRTVIRTWRR